MRATEKDFSGTTIAGTAVVYAEDNLPDIRVFFQNASDTDMRIEFNGTALATVGRLVAAGGFYETPGFVPAGRLTVYCASGGKSFVCKTV